MTGGRKRRVEGRRYKFHSEGETHGKLKQRGRLWNDLSCLPGLPALRRLVSRLPEWRTTDVFWSAMDGLMYQFYPELRV